MCITPMFRREYNVNVPCGRCPECVKRRVSQWSVRLQKEADVSTSAFFVTLTFSTHTVPISQNGYMTLDKEPLQLFFKRLRKRSYQKIKYYAVGEYGGKFKRPHYHIILFNATEKAICDSWALGQIHIGKVEPASIAYCFKYISKDKTIKQHQNDDRVKEFSLMSKGIGKCYTDDPKNIQWHHNNLEERYYVPIRGGDKASMPRYYRDRIYNSEQFGYLKGVLEQNAFEKQDEINKKYSSYHMAQYHMQEFKKMHQSSLKENIK